MSRSSTEAELIGVYDVSPMMIWTLHFLEAQGFAIQDNVQAQENKSAKLLEENGRASSSKRTKHIHIRYFFIKARADNKEIRIDYCPTDQMVGDFFTKSLRGMAFRKHRDLILNIASDDPYHSKHRSVLSMEHDQMDKSTDKTLTRNDQTREASTRSYAYYSVGSTNATTTQRSYRDVVVGEYAHSFVFYGKA
jgi:hypothetical protein